MEDPVYEEKSDQAKEENKCIENDIKLNQVTEESNEKQNQNNKNDENNFENTHKKSIEELDKTEADKVAISKPEDKTEVKEILISEKRATETENLKDEKENLEKKKPENIIKDQIKKEKKLKKSLKKSSTVNAEESKITSDYLKDIMSDPTVDIVQELSGELNQIKTTLNNLFIAGNLDAAIFGYQRGYDQHKLFLKIVKDNIDMLNEERRISFQNSLPSIKMLGRDFLRNTGTILLKKDKFKECIENDLIVNFKI